MPVFDPLSPDTTKYFDPILAQFPELANSRSPIAPVRVGVDRKSGKILMGWDHVQQSLTTIFSTPFHERVLRRYVGSFVPHILGENAVPTIVTRFYWAMVSAIDLWEPNYRIKRVLFMNYAIADAYSPAQSSGAEQLRSGNAVFRHEGVYRPRAHLGDLTPETQRTIGLVSRGSTFWDVVPVPVAG